MQKEPDLKITPLQSKVLDSEAKITIVSAGRGAGKTGIMSIVSIMNMVKGKKVLLIGPIWRQLEDSNFVQTLKFLKSMKVPYDINKSKLRIRVGKGELLHISGEDPESIRGYTSIDVLIFDEAASLHEDCWKLAIATMRDTKDGQQKIYVVGTPPDDETHWVSKLAMRDDVNIIFGSYKDNPFNGEEFAKLLEKEYENYPEDFKQRELFGQFIFSNSSGSLFSNFKIEMNEEIEFPDDPIVAGLDIAGSGNDMTCLCISQGDKIQAIYLTKTNDEIKLKQFLKEKHADHNFSVLRYDSTGMGHLLSFDIEAEIEAVNFGDGAGDRYADARTLIHFMLRQKKTIYMRKDVYNSHYDKIMGELKAIRIREQENRRIGLIKKPEIRRAIGRSPDRADAIALSMSYTLIENKPRSIHVPPIFGRSYKL
jgi:phage terminase large subunit